MTAQGERLKALAQSWRNLAYGYEIRGKNAKTEPECVRYAQMNATMLHCADALENDLRVGGNATADGAAGSAAVPAKPPVSDVGHSHETGAHSVTSKTRTLRGYVRTGDGMIPAIEGDKRIYYAAEDVAELETDRDCLVLALGRLVRKMEECHEDEAFKSVWMINQLHTGPYTGPKYEEAFLNAQAYLKHRIDSAALQAETGVNADGK